MRELVCEEEAQVEKGPTEYKTREVSYDPNADHALERDDLMRADGIEEGRQSLIRGLDLWLHLDQMSVQVREVTGVLSSGACEQTAANRTPPT